MVDAQAAVKIRAADPHPVIGENLDASFPGAEDREIRGAAADVDDQPGLAGPAEAVAGQRRRLGLVQEADALESGGQIAVAQVGFGRRIARRVTAVEMPTDVPKFRTSENGATPSVRRSCASVE